jgi:two-component system sensor kinase FixL
MKKPPQTPNEHERIEALKRYDLLDTAPDLALDSLTQAASKLCDAPMALITLIDSNRQWFKSRVGIDLKETPRDIAFCAHTITHPNELTVIEDMTHDDRFRDNPFVTGEVHVRFYAGQPLLTPDGYALGALCVLDRQPKKLSAVQREGLGHLATAISTLIEERRHLPIDVISRAIQNTQHHALTITDARGDDNPIVFSSPGFEEMSGYSAEEVLGRNCRFLQGDETDPTAVAELRQAIEEAREYTVVLKNYRKDGSAYWNEITVSPIRDVAGEVTHFLGFQNDVSERRRTQDALRLSEFELKQANRLAKLGYMEWDIDTFRILNCSDNLPELFGLPKEQLLGDPKYFEAILHPEDSAKVTSSEKQLSSDPVSYECNFRIITDNNEVRYFREVGEPVSSDDGGIRYFRACLQDVTEHALTSFQLNESRRRLTTLIGNLPGMVFRCRNDEKHTMEFVSKGCLELTGYSYEELIVNSAKDQIELIEPAARTKYLATVNSALEAGCQYSVEYELTTATGERKWAWEHGTGIASSEGKVVAIEGYIVDITARKHAELAQRASDTRFTDFGRIAADWFWEMGPDLRFTYVSGRIGELLGISASDVIGKTREELYRDSVESRTVWVEHLKEMETHQPFSDFDIVWTRPDGTTCSISLNGEPQFGDDGSFAGYRGVGRDVTTQKRNESQLRAFFELSPDAIVIIDNDRSIRFANTMASTLFDYSHKELIGRAISDLLPDVVWRRYTGDKQAESVTSHTQKMGNELDLSARKSDGRLFPVEIGISPIEDAGKTLLLATVRDISERKLYEEQERQRLLDHAHDARLSTAGELASGLAHELNQPLLAISSNCDTGLLIAKESPSIDAELVQILEENYAYALRAGQIIHSLRKLVQKAEPDQTPTDINTLIEGTCKLIASEANTARVRIRLELMEQLPLIVLDAVHIQQVLVNLERNAIESLSNTNTAVRTLVISSTLDPAGYVKVSVADNGQGVSDKIIDQIFDPHVTSRISGMGLGLSISRSMIETHGGQLWIDTDCTFGAVFHFTLPVEPELELEIDASIEVEQL